MARARNLDARVLDAAPGTPEWTSERAIVGAAIFRLIDDVHRLCRRDLKAPRVDIIHVNGGWHVAVTRPGLQRVTATTIEEARGKLGL